MLALIINIGHCLILSCSNVLFSNMHSIKCHGVCRRQVEERREHCGLRHYLLEKNCCQMSGFKKLKLLVWSLVGTGLKGRWFFLSFINICWRANGFLCAWIFPLFIGEIISSTGISYDKIHEAETEWADGCIGRNLPQVISCYIVTAVLSSQACLQVIKYSGICKA